MTKKYFYLEYKNKFTQDIIIKNVFNEIFIFCGDIKHEIIINNIKKDNITEDFLNLCIYYLFKYQMEDRPNYKLDILNFLNRKIFRFFIINKLILKEIKFIFINYYIKSNYLAKPP